MPSPDQPRLVPDATNPALIRITGRWQVNALTQDGVIASLQARLADSARLANARWDLTNITGLDHIGARLLWNAWGKQRPSKLLLAPLHEGFFKRIEAAGELALPVPETKRRWGFFAVLDSLRGFSDHVLGFVGLIGQLVLDVLQFARAPQRGPWREISANIFHTGYQALGITALVGLLIGVVLSYLSAEQLHSFGGDIYLVNILGMSIVRELGPMLAAILVAGRSGSSITAQLGVMRVTEELDAMQVMGLPHGFRLIMPKVLALAISMPFLVIWTDAMALIGGMLAAKAELGLSPSYFFQRLPNVVPIANYWIGLGKGVVFGTLIALVACHFGLRIKPNTESLGQGTTVSVVTAITIVILADAVFAIIFSDVGY